MSNKFLASSSGRCETGKNAAANKGLKNEKDNFCLSTRDFCRGLRVYRYVVAGFSIDLLRELERFCKTYFTFGHRKIGWLAWVVRLARRERALEGAHQILHPQHANIGTYGHRAEVR
jgi:hypothetical protein